MDDPRVIAAEAAFKRVGDLIEAADRMDPTNPTTIRMTIMDGEWSQGHWIGPYSPASDQMAKYSRLKAEISLRTGRSVYDILKNAPDLLLPHEQELRSERAGHKLYAGGVPMLDKAGVILGSVGVAGAGRGLDCHCAKLLASEYLNTLRVLAAKAA